MQEVGSHCANGYNVTWEVIVQEVIVQKVVKEVGKHCAKGCYVTWEVIVQEVGSHCAKRNVTWERVVM